MMSVSPEFVLDNPESDPRSRWKPLASVTDSVDAD
jgi:hypothetical protein